MKKFVKVLSIVLVIALIGAFAACGGAADKDNSGDDAKATLKIGVQTNTTGDLYSSWDFGDDAVVRYDNGALAVEALKNNKVDIVIIDNEPAKALVNANKGLKILETSYADEDYAICVKKGNTDLLDKINKAIDELVADGTIDAIVAKYIK